MILDYSSPGKVKVQMHAFVDRMLDCAHKDFAGMAYTPAQNNLFTTFDDSAELLDRDRADHFHTMVAKGLYLCKRARPDIQTAISYLCTRVAKPNTADWKKLGRLIQYLRYTRDLYLTLEANDDLSLIHI